MAPHDQEDREALLARLLASEEAHKKTQERLELLSQASFEGIMVHVDGVNLQVNQRLAEILRCQPEDLLGPNTILRCVAPEDLPATLERMSSGYEGAYTITGIRFDGERFRAEIQSKQGRLGDRPVRIAAVRDITERERMEALLREGERHLHDLAVGAFDFMVVTQDGYIIDVGGNVEAIVGRTREEMIGHDALDFVTEDQREQTGLVISENRPGAYETALEHKSGRRVPVEVVGVHSTVHGAPARVAGFRDLTEMRRAEAEKRKLEQQLQRAQRLDSLGVLAGGIAHDFNNLLVGILGSASLLQATLSEPADLQAVEDILAAGERAANLSRQMLAYAGRQDLQRREPIDLSSLLRELRRLIEATLSKKATLVLEPQGGTVVLGDRALLTQVLLNLLTNASDALGNAPGQISVRTRAVHEPTPLWQSALGAKIGPGEWVQVEIEDTGCGMDEATRERAFEPFFSTKERGQGLGLAACLGIVTNLGGALRVDSSPGQGSCFALLLPAAEPAAAVTAPRVRVDGERCRVLVIDDEELVRHQLRRTLELRGYHVEEAVDGLSGIEHYKDRGADVLIIDVTMPDIDGIEVVRRIRGAGSRAAIILSSGYQAEPAADRLEPSEYQGFLPKPYGMREVLEAVERARARVGTQG